MIWTWGAPPQRSARNTVTHIHSYRPAFAAGAGNFEISSRLFSTVTGETTVQIARNCLVSTSYPYLAFFAETLPPVLIRLGELGRFFTYHGYHAAQPLANRLELDPTCSHILVPPTEARPAAPYVAWVMDSSFLNDFISPDNLEGGLHLEAGVDLVGAGGERESGTWRLYPRQQDRYLVELSDGDRFVATLGGLIRQLENNHQDVPEDLRSQPGLPTNRRI